MAAAEKTQLRSCDCKARERDKPRELTGKEKGGGGAAIPCGQQDLECNFTSPEVRRCECNVCHTDYELEIACNTANLLPSHKLIKSVSTFCERRNS
jgi:hypothetical protein